MLPLIRTLFAAAAAALLLADGSAARQTPIQPVAAGALGQARTNGAHFEQSVAASQRLLHAWLEHADPRTLLLPDRLDADRSKWVYTPHNSGADLYPYLVLTAQL